jgi:uncharacterized protein (TIGR03437 family)
MTKPRRTLIAKIVVILAVIPVLIYAYAEGPYPGYSGVPGENGDCTSCHYDTLNSGGGNVTVAFPNGASYVPGVKQHLKVTVQDAAQQRWGFQLTARQQSNSGTQAGSFTAGSDGFTQVICATNDFSCSSSSDLQYIEHTWAGTRYGTAKSATFEFDWTPPATNVGNVVVYVAGNAANGDGGTFGDHIYTNTYKVTAASAANKPAITRVENAAGFQTTIAAGSWLDIKGTNLASTTATWSNAIVNGNLPTELPGTKTTVTVNGKPAYVYYISPTQVNVLAPADTSAGNVQVVVTNNGVASSPSTATMQAFSPACFLWPGNYVVATHEDFTFAVKSGEFPGTQTTPAKPGDIITLWGTGLGPLSPAPPSGKVPSGGPYNMTATPTITIGGMQAGYVAGALSPYAGLYQVAIKVPNLADGDWPISIEIGGVSSPTGALLTVKQ